MYLCWQPTHSPRSCHPAQRRLLLRMRLVGGRRVQHFVTRRFVQKFLPYRHRPSASISASTPYRADRTRTPGEESFRG